MTETVPLIIDTDRVSGSLLRPALCAAGMSWFAQSHMTGVVIAGSLEVILLPPFLSSFGETRSPAHFVLLLASLCLLGVYLLITGFHYFKFREYWWVYRENWHLEYIGTRHSSLCGTNRNSWRLVLMERWAWCFWFTLRFQTELQLSLKVYWWMFVDPRRQK